jgi:hypothetical protein
MARAGTTSTERGTQRRIVGSLNRLGSAVADVVPNGGTVPVVWFRKNREFPSRY